MNILRTIMNFLYALDSEYLSNWPVQIILLISSIAAFTLHIPGVTIWLGLGLVVYALLTGLNFYRDGVKKELADLAKLHKKHGMFPFLKGFNYCLILGPLGIALAVLMAVTSKSEK